MILDVHYTQQMLCKIFVIWSFGVSPIFASELAGWFGELQWLLISLGFLWERKVGAMLWLPVLGNSLMFEAISAIFAVYSPSFYCNSLSCSHALVFCSS